MSEQFHSNKPQDAYQRKGCRPYQSKRGRKSPRKNPHLRNAHNRKGDQDPADNPCATYDGTNDWALAWHTISFIRSGHRHGAS